MPKNQELSARGMVSYILFREMGRYFSNTELRAEITRKFGKKLYRETVTRALREIDYTTGLLNEEIRPGRFNKEIKFYSISL